MKPLLFVVSVPTLCVCDAGLHFLICTMLLFSGKSSACSLKQVLDTWATYCLQIDFMWPAYFFLTCVTQYDDKISGYQKT
jgi:hypothetical protein